MGRMDRILANSIKRVGIGAKDKIIVAVSGGIDSVTLLDLCAQKFPAKNLVIAHANHGLRKESAKEEKFVENIAKKYGVAFEPVNLNLKNASEETSRNKRYQFLHHIKEKYGAKYIAVAHHANDQAETVLLKLARGTGPTELWGMKEVEADLWRPLLSVPKKEIKAYAKKRNLKHVTDTSNQDLKYARNRIRKNVIPELEKINPKFISTITSETTLGQELENYISAESKKNTSENIIDLKKLKKLDPFLQKQVIFECLKKFTPRDSGIYQKNVAEILKIAYAKGNKQTKIAGFTIAKNYDKIVFDFRSQRTQKRADIKLGKNEFNGWVLLASEKTNEKSRKNNVLLPAEYVDKIFVRVWQSGDKIKTKSGTKKLQDVFTDKKVPKDERDRWPIVIIGKEIVWVPGLQASNRALSRSKNKCLKIEVKSEKRY